MTLFDQFLLWVLVTLRNYVDETELRGTLYIEFLKHKQQLKIYFLAGKHNMKHFWPQTIFFLVLVSYQHHYNFMPTSGG